MEFALRHDFLHEVRELHQVSKNVRNYIELNSHLRPSQIFCQLKEKLSEGKFQEMNYIKLSHVHFHWARIQTAKYKRHSDPMTSALIMLKEYPNVHVICPNTENNFSCLGIVTSIFPTIFAADGLSRNFYVDSTRRFEAISF